MEEFSGSTLSSFPWSPEGHKDAPDTLWPPVGQRQQFLTPVQEVCDVFLPLQGGLAALGEEAEQQVEQRLHAQTSGLLLLQQQLLQPLQTGLSRHPGWGEKSASGPAHKHAATVLEEDGAQAPFPGESSRAQPANYAASLAPGNIPEQNPDPERPCLFPDTVASLPRLSASRPGSVCPPHRVLIPLNLDFPLRNRDVGQPVDPMRLPAAAPYPQRGPSGRYHVRELCSRFGSDNNELGQRERDRRSTTAGISVVLICLPVWRLSGNMAESRTEP